ncbi:hypothetical protein JS278_01066 [Acidipropionibacterium virtanenii]|uniref:DUF2207 domain-containing protein n=2 Tax=Acidipropionibacterium virtanenii TaxID=2057246 RepID=A0A344USK1_9ACTN|nr:hypothetical protein JS278_01066 [Acidipropionibacterium virtanenii]
MLSAVTVQGTVPARADDDTPSSWNIPSYDLKAQVDKSGDAHVTLDMAFDFADDEGHGPYITFSTRQKLTDDPDHWRMIDYSDIRASSPSGADATVETKNESGAMMIRLGSEGREFTGVQRYRISFTVHGLISLKNPQSGMDEVNWQVFNGFDVPMDSAKVTVTGPTGLKKVACFNDGDPCDATSSGSTGSFDAGMVPADDPLQVVAGFPAGTFDSTAEARTTKRFHAGNTFGLGVGSGLGTAIAALVAGWFAVRGQRRRRDQEFLGVPPGVIPPQGQGDVGTRKSSPQVAVAFQPPKNVSPAEAGTLVDGTAGTDDVTAAMLDLAVRGHMKITPKGTDRKGRTKDWTFTLNPNSPDELRPWEKTFVQKFFHGSATVDTANMRTQNDDTTLPETKSALDQVMVTYGWYRKSPSTARALAFLAGLGVLFLGVLIAVVGLFFGYGLVGVPVAIIGLVMAIIGIARTPGRTATGTAILDQINGFKLYLTTAEADQIRFEEGIDVFSRYLPWATMFGVADRWVKIFADLQASGRYTGYYGWYGGDINAFNMGFAAGFASSMSDMTSAMSSSMESAATSSTSSSGSGFSGGGGFGGGGGGGW